MAVKDAQQRCMDNYTSGRALFDAPPEVMSAFISDHLFIYSLCSFMMAYFSMCIGHFDITGFILLYVTKINVSLCL